jgi:formylglycine-generating enzyme required for sulfatase activity
MGQMNDAFAWSDFGSFPPNAWGIYDLHCNIWEWCEDKYEASSSSRVLRGGS